MNVLEVKGLCKDYPAFHLKDVAFSLEPGKITGFIGRNGAGKTTTMKSILGFVRPDDGEIRFFGESFAGHETDIKRRIGYVSGGFDCYPRKKLKTITAVTASFYKDWDGGAYRSLLKRFALEEEKTPLQLSAGMRVKYALALALSHGAKLLLLDEPTSGLDPVSRDELLDIFLDLSAEGTTIFFSTHITSDLDKCADNILYLKQGRILADDKLAAFTENYRVIEIPGGIVPPSLHDKIAGFRRTKTGNTILVKTADAPAFRLPAEHADLEEIMIHLEREEES